MPRTSPNHTDDLQTKPNLFTSIVSLLVINSVITLCHRGYLLSAQTAAPRLEITPRDHFLTSASCMVPAMLTSGHCRMYSMQRHNSFCASGSMTASLPQYATFCTGFQFSRGSIYNNRIVNLSRT